MPTVTLTERLYICPIVVVTPPEGGSYRCAKIALIEDPGVVKDLGPPKVFSHITHTAIISDSGPGKCLVRAFASDWTKVDADPECVRLMPSVQNPNFMQRLDQALTPAQIAALGATIEAETGVAAGTVTGDKKLLDVLDSAGRGVHPAWRGSLKETIQFAPRSLQVSEGQIEP